MAQHNFQTGAYPEGATVEQDTFAPGPGSEEYGRYNTGGMVNPPSDDGRHRRTWTRPSRNVRKNYLADPQLSPKPTSILDGIFISGTQFSIKSLISVT